MFQPKPIYPDAIPRALEKAERYRLLNEPEEAESICLDILAIDPDNQPACITLLLALTDQFHHNCTDCLARAQALLPQLQAEYERCYYAGIICERRGSAQIDRDQPGCKTVAYNWLRQAMDWYEQAEAIRPPHNDDAILRWNTCARIMQKHELAPPAVESFEPVLLE
jgi:hypothetical protein